MGKNQDPGSGINIPDPQHCWNAFPIFIPIQEIQIQCCGSWMFIPDLGCLSWIPDLNCSIPDPKSRVKKILDPKTTFAEKNFSIFSPKNCDLDFLPIPDPESRGQKDTGSG
jgi:hypothetical protein